MTKHYCDRCGKELDSDDAKYPICIMPKELCIKCATAYDAMQRSLKEYVERVEKEFWKGKPKCIPIKLERRESNESNR